MKKFTAFLFTVILLVSVLFINASAVGELAVASVHFDTVINADGTVDVTETWNIEYSETGEGFTRWIDLYDSKNSNGMTALEKFESIENITVSINGKTVSEAETGNNTYRCGNSADGRSFNIEIDSPSADETKEYVITYTLNGAVKKNGKNAEFAYVFLGETFEFVSNNVSATVYFPEGTVSEDIVVDENSTGLISETTVKYSPGRVYDTFRIDVKCGTDVFENEALVQYSAFKEGMKKALNVLLDVLYWLFIAAVVITVIILALFSDKIKRHSIEKKAKKQVADTANASVAELPDEISACVAYKMVMPYSRIAPKSTSKKVPCLFAMAILECIEKGYIVASDDELMIGTPSGEVPVYLMSVLNFLKTFSEKKGNRYIIDSTFAEKIKAECSGSYDVISNYLATFYNLIPATEGKFFKSQTNKELYEKVYILRCRINSEKNKTMFADCMRKVLAGEKTGEKDVLSFLFTSVSANKVFNDSEGDIASVTADALSAMYNCFIKSK